MSNKKLFSRPTERAAEKALVASFSKEARESMKDCLPPLPTREEIIAKAGGRVVSMASLSSVAEWHELGQ